MTSLRDAPYDDGHIQNEKQPLLAPVDDHHGVSGDQTSVSETLINLLKAMVASGFLSLPFAISQAGYALGGALMLFIAIVCTWCMLLLVRTKQTLSERHDRAYLSYADVGRLSLGWLAPPLIDAFILITQLGFCCVYVLFIAQHMHETLYAFIFLPVFIMLSWIKSLKVIAPTSVVANLLIVYASIVILVYVGKHMGSDDIPADPTCKPSGNSTCYVASKPIPLAPISTVPIFFGNTIYSFEGIGVVLPMENAMAEPSRFPFVVTLAMVIVTIFYTGFAILGYITFGGAVQGSITLNLPDNVLNDTVKIGLCICLLQSYSIQFFPAINIMERWYLKKLERMHPGMFVITRNGARALIVLGTVGLAIAIPKLGLFISLIGSLGSGALALIFPPLMHFYANRGKLSFVSKASDWFIVAFGVLGSVAGTFTAVKAIVDALA